MSEQIPLSFDKPKAAAPGVRQLEDFLRGKGWIYRREISARLGWSERTVRELAAASDEVISYPGSPGYKLMADCTREEYDHYRNARRSQVRGMISKLLRTDRRFFAHPKATP
jgi:hypothetical protein